MISGIWLWCMWRGSLRMGTLMLGPGSPGFPPLAMMATDVAVAVSPLAKFPLERLSAHGDSARSALREHNWHPSTSLALGRLGPQ
jgi:hypothetical protein